MSVWVVCPKHGLLHPKGKPCPKCTPEPDKSSKKYGGVSVHIPPHMKASK